MSSLISDNVNSAIEALLSISLYIRSSKVSGITDRTIKQDDLFVFAKIKSSYKAP